MKTALIFVILITGCTTGKLDKKFVKDADGNIYQLDWRIGECYLPKPVNRNEIDSLINKSK